MEIGQQIYDLQRCPDIDSSNDSEDEQTSSSPS